jgi:hypothetical protein
VINVLYLVPLDQPTLIPNTGLRITQHGPNKTWLLEVVDPHDGCLWTNLICPPAYSLDPPYSMIKSSNFWTRSRYVMPLIEFDLRLEWNLDHWAALTGTDTSEWD